MAADLKRSLGSVLVMAHPLEIGVQKRLIDLLLRQRIQKPRFTKIAEETIYGGSYSTEVFSQGSPIPALQWISLEKVLNLS
jgi:hypothetical protein